MKQEGINSTRLAEMLGIQASGISHIMSGRNKPSFDFLVKLLQRFPQINPDWLLIDKGPMYRDEIKKSASLAAAAPAGQTTVEASQAFSAPQTQQDAGLFSEPSRTDPSTIAHPAAPVSVLERDDEDIIPSNAAPGQVPRPAKGFLPSSSIERIVVFYKDKTFSEYQPE